MDFGGFVSDCENVHSIIRRKQKRTLNLLDKLLKMTRYLCHPDGYNFLNHLGEIKCINYLVNGNIITIYNTTVVCLIRNINIFRKAFLLYPNMKWKICMRCYDGKINHQLYDKKCKKIYLLFFVIIYINAQVLQTFFNLLRTMI